jgi:hypothetical protein
MSRVTRTSEQLTNANQVNWTTTTPTGSTLKRKGSSNVVHDRQRVC